MHRIVKSDKVEICDTMIVRQSNVFNATVILGDPFIRNYYIYHDMENKRIGMYGDHMVYYMPTEHNSIDTINSINLSISIEIMIAVFVGIL